MLEALDEAEREQVKRALFAAAEGPFFPDGGFKTRFGVSRTFVQATVLDFPNLSHSNRGHFLAVNNALFMLGTCVHKREEDFDRFGVRREDVLRVVKKLRMSLGFPTKEFMDYFE
jgi:hypothetical protein